MPQLFQTMPCRIEGYKAALEGFNATDIHLIAYNDICNNGNNILSPSGYTDHVGSYLYIPFLSKLFNLSQETFAGIRVIKAYNKSNSTIKNFNKEAENYRSIAMNLVTTESLFYPVILFLQSQN